MDSAASWEVKRISGDGSCLFSAVADQLYDDPSRQKEVRAIVFKQMSANSDKYKGFFTGDTTGDEANSAKELELLDRASKEGEEGQEQTELLRQAWEMAKKRQSNNEQESFVTHLNKLRLNGSWGSQPDITAIQDATGIPIEVYTGEVGNFTLVAPYTEAPKGQNPLRLLFTGNHYDSIRDTSRDDIYPLIKDITTKPVIIPPTENSVEPADPPVKTPNKAATLALLKAVTNNDADAARAAIGDGAFLEAKGDKSGFTPLHTAAIHDNTDVAQVLLDNGAEIEAKDNDGATPLYAAAYNGKSAMTQLLLEKGADIEAKTNKGFNALHAASSNGHTEITQLLLGKGADIEAKGRYGSTALHYAVSDNHAAVVKLLLDRGADINAKDAAGKTALDFAETEDVKQLLGAPTIIVPPLDSDSDSGEEGVVASLLASAADIIALLLLHMQEKEKLQTIATESEVVAPESAVAVSESEVAAPVVAESVAAAGPKAYVLPITKNDLLYLIKDGNNIRLITKKDAVKGIDLATFATLSPTSSYGKVEQLTYPNQTTVALQDAGKWIESILDSAERAVIRKLLRGRGITIHYAMPPWAKAIIDNNAVCETFKERVRKAVRLSKEKLAEDDTQTMADLEQLIKDDDPKIAKIYQTERVFVKMDNDNRTRAFTVPNPYRATKVRNTYTNFANPTGAISQDDPMAKEVASRNTQLVQSLIPKELYADKNIMRAILEGLWYCGQHPDSRSHPGCFMARFLGELRGMKQAEGVEQVETAAQRIVEKANTALDLIQYASKGKGMDIRQPFILPPPFKAQVKPINTA